MAKSRIKDDPEKIPEIRIEYDPGEEKRELIKMVYDRFEEMKTSEDRQRAEKVWDEADKAWEAHREDREDWQSNHYVPLTTAIVETALAEMVDQTPRPLILPRSSDDNPKAQVMKHVYDYTWDVADGDTEVFNVMKDTLTYGTAIGQEYYRQDRRIIKLPKLAKDGKLDFEEREAMDYDDCAMEVVKLQDFYVDDKARSFDGPYAARDCVRRYVMDIRDARLFFSGDTWNPFDGMKFVKPGGRDTNYYEYFKPPTSHFKDNDVEVLWYWSTRPKDWLIIVINDVLIKAGGNPYRHKKLPFARSVDVKRVHSFYGKGEPELLESIQDEANTLRRMIIDRNHLDIDKMFLVSDTLSLNDDDLIARPHGMIPTGGDANSAKPIEYGDIPRSVELSLNNLNEDAVIVTGIDPRQATRSQPSTATEAALLKEAALKKVRMKLRLFEREFLVRIARLRVANIIQYYPQPTLEKIIGEKGTAEYKNAIAQAKDQGTLQEIDGQSFTRNQRQIRVEGKRFEINEKGEPTFVANPGFSFFDAKGEYYVPSSQGGFDIKFAAGSTLPISKPLMQTKVQEMYDRLIQLALQGIGYDPIKLGDMLLRTNDFNPEELKTTESETASADAGFEDERLQQLIDLATQENELMMQEQPIDPTGYASPAHTQIHLQFMNSDEFQNLPGESPIVQIFTKHVMGEIAAQQARQGGQPPEGGAPGGLAQSTNGNVPSFQGQGQQAPPPQTGGNTNNPMKQMMPGLIQGGGDVPLQ